MGDMLKELREKSRKRKLLLAQTVSRTSNTKKPNDNNLTLKIIFS